MSVAIAIGMTFARLTVTGPAEPVVYASGTKLRWECKCVCGRMTIVDASALRRGRTRSCGCLMREIVAEMARVRSHKHGRASREKTAPEYHSWRSLLYRCTNPDSRAWPSYGGRGIAVCDRWQGEHGFENFFADMGPRPSGTTIDRIDNDKGYFKHNCRWATPLTQTRNRRCMPTLTVDGVTRLVCEWAEQLGVTSGCLLSRHRAGWSDERIVKTPYGGYGATRWNGQAHHGIRTELIEGVPHQLLMIGRKRDIEKTANEHPRSIVRRPTRGERATWREFDAFIGRRFLVMLWTPVSGESRKAA